MTKNTGMKAPKGQRSKVELAKELFAECSREYLDLSLDPFRVEHAACLPTTPALPSRKLTVVTRGTAVVGTNGFGYVLCYPRDSVANNATSVASSGIVFSGSTMISTGTGVDTAQSNSPFDSTDFGGGDDDLQYRCVAAGIRVRYIGTELQRGGVILPYTQPDHRSLDGSTLSDVMEDVLVTTYPVDRKWHGAIWSPAKNIDYRFAPSLDVIPDMGVMFTGSAGNSFEFEFYSHFEIIGDGVSASCTPSHTDAQGFGYVQQILGHPVTKRVVAAGKQGLVRWAWSQLASALVGPAGGALRIEPSRIMHEGL